MASGAKLDENVIKVYTEEVKMSKTSNYIIFKLEGGQIVVDSKGNQPIVFTQSAEKKLALENESQLKEFEKLLPANDCRWAVVDVEVNLGASEGKRNKLVFIQWSPDDTPVKKKMPFASSSDVLKNALQVQTIVQVNSPDELKENIIEKLEKK